MLAEAKGLATVKVATSTCEVAIPRNAVTVVGEATMGTSVTTAVLLAMLGGVPGGSVESVMVTVTLSGEPGIVKVV